MAQQAPPSLGGEDRAALRRILEHPKFELIPLKNVLDQARFLPEGADVTLTASPTKTLEASLDLAAELQQMGFSVIPHLSARMTRDRAHLASLLARLESLEIERIFLVGGDAPPAGEFFDAFSLLEAMNHVGHHLTEIGVTSYPEGHPVIPEESLRQALSDKQPHASYMTTQMCFDPVAVTDFVTRCRADSITLPVHLGIPGVAERLKLIQISARIGVGQSIRFLSKQSGLVRRLIKPGGYSPDELLEQLIPALQDPVAAIQNVHIYTFNQCETTERWRTEYLAGLLESGDNR